MNKPKPVVGQTLYLLKLDYNARDREQPLTPVIVDKVGTKYFTCHKSGEMHGGYGTRFRIDTWVEDSDYPSRLKLYPNEQAWSDDKETNEILRFLRETFSRGFSLNKLDLQDLRHIRDTIISKEIIPSSSQ